MTRQERIAMKKRIQGSGGMVTGKSAGDIAITCVTWGILFSSPSSASSRCGTF